MLFAKRKTDEQKISSNNSLWHTLRRPIAGEPVNDDTVFKYSAFFACVRIISETCAYLPWRVYEREGSKRFAVTGNAVDRLLYSKPNPEMAPFYFKELLQSKLCTKGNFYAEIERNRFGEPVALWPLENDRVKLDRDKRGLLYYDIDNGTTTLTPNEVFHVKGPSRDGLNGMSIIDIARESISMGLAAQAFGAGFFGNGAIPSIVITNKEGKAKLNSEGAKNLLDTWRKNNGKRNQRGVEYLDPGLDFQVVGLAPEDAQFIQTADFSIYEMCRWFRIPPHKLAQLARATHTNIESQNIEFVTDAILPALTRMESTANFSLFSAEEADKYYTKFNVMALLRGDSVARAQFYKDLFNMGVLDTNEIREKEDLDPVEDGQNVRLVPVNMVTVERMKSGQIGNQGKTNTAQAIAQDLALKMCKIELKIVKSFTIETDKQKIVDFYVGHARTCAEAFRKISCLFLELCNKKTDKIDQLLAEFFGDMAGKSADEFYFALAAGKKEAILASWEANKAHKLTDSLINRLADL